jgi:hypothetical protein
MNRTHLIRPVILLFVATVFTAGCATSADRKLDQKVNAQNSASTPQDLRTEVKDAIAETPGLTDAQKSALTTLRINTQKEIKALNVESIKLRSVLIENVFAKKTNDDEVKRIKSRLRKIEDKKLDLTFKAVDKSYTILGKQAVNNQKMMDEMVNDPRMGRLE